MSKAQLSTKFYDMPLLPSLKKCPTCKEDKPFTAFVKDKNKRDGYNTYCKKCVADRLKQSYVPSERKKNFFYVNGKLTEKRCGTCKEWKPVADFSPNGKGYRWNCKECEAARRREDRLVTPVRYRNVFLQRLYGLSLAEYDAMLEAQGGVCKCCHHPEIVVDARTGRLRSLSVDHCHKTGAIRGLLCQSCNQGLGSIREDADRARALVEYIETVVYY